MCFKVLSAAFLLALGVGSSASSAVLEYYVGIDSRTTPFAAPAGEGGGNYPDNPNFGRLTMLYAHGVHYHALGTYNYSGPSAMPTLNATNANNRFPEISSLQDPLPLTPGSGVYAGKNVTKALPGVDFSNLEIQSVHSLANSGVTETEALYRSSTNRWDGAFDDADIHLELVSVSSPWLNVGTPTDPLAFSGGEAHLGEGNELFSFTPVLWVDANAPGGDYWAEFRLVDESGTFGDSGTFFIDVNQVPEPSTLAVVGMSLAGVLVLRKRLA
jgi:hypothetical protein